MGCSASATEVIDGERKFDHMKEMEKIKKMLEIQNLKNDAMEHSFHSYKKEESKYRYSDNIIFQSYNIYQKKGKIEEQEQKKIDNVSEEFILETENKLEENVVTLKSNRKNSNKKEAKNNNEPKDDVNENNKNNKIVKKKVKKKITKRISFKKKLKELEKKEKELEKKEKDILDKENNHKEDEEKYLKDEKDFKEEKESFENKKIQKNSKLNERKKNLNKKEEELKKLEEKYFPKIKPILIGLNNIGATCYMNASLQCLSNTKELTEYFLKNYKEKDKNIQIMSHEYHRVLRHLWDEKSQEKAYSPNSFKDVLSKENPLFAGIAANDSKDFINFLIERLHQELNEVNKDNNGSDTWMQINQANETEVLKVFLQDFTTTFNSPISKLFYGISETKSQCQGCSIIKYNFQVYSFLEFPLQQVNQFYFNNGKRPLLTNDGKNPDVDLYECFEYNRKIDLMIGDNQMYCNICNKLCNAYYSTILYSGPNYLILHLNRGRGAVYECNVNFPEKLNIFNYITYNKEGTLYELYAVICHLGPSSMSGHFVAYCRNRMDNQWYLYNDGLVNLCAREQQYKDGMPYILFYKLHKNGD